MNRFEYLTFEHLNNHPMMEGQLEKLGLAGWELVSALGNTYGEVCTMIFKRLIVSRTWREAKYLEELGALGGKQ